MRSPSPVQNAVRAGFDATASGLNATALNMLKLAEASPWTNSVQFNADTLSSAQLREVLEKRGLAALTAPGGALDGISGSHLPFLTGRGWNAALASRGVPPADVEKVLLVLTAVRSRCTVDAAGRVVCSDVR